MNELTNMWKSHFWIEISIQCIHVIASRISKKSNIISRTVTDPKHCLVECLLSLSPMLLNCTKHVWKVGERRKNPWHEPAAIQLMRWLCKLLWQAPSVCGWHSFSLLLSCRICWVIFLNLQSGLWIAKCSLMWCDVVSVQTQVAIFTSIDEAPLQMVDNQKW